MTAVFLQGQICHQDCLMSVLEPTRVKTTKYPAIHSVQLRNQKLWKTLNVCIHLQSSEHWPRLPLLLRKSTDMSDLLAVPLASSSLKSLFCFLLWLPDLWETAAGYQTKQKQKQQQHTQRHTQKRVVVTDVCKLPVLDSSLLWKQNRVHWLF